VSHDVKQKKRMDMRVWVSDEEALFVLAEALGVQCSPPREDLRWTSPHGDEPWVHCTWQGGVADLLQLSLVDAVRAGRSSSWSAADTLQLIY
jgi:hypothetical protein